MSIFQLHCMFQSETVQLGIPLCFQYQDTLLFESGLTFHLEFCDRSGSNQTRMSIHQTWLDKIDQLDNPFFGFWYYPNRKSSGQYHEYTWPCIQLWWQFAFQNHTQRNNHLYLLLLWLCIWKIRMIMCYATIKYFLYHLLGGPLQSG